MEKEKVVLAYSGGLDTSVCLKWLQVKHDLDVIALCVDVGQEREDLEFIRRKAIDMGAYASIAIDARDEYVNYFLTKALAANSMYENKYPLLSALSRPVIVKHLVEVAEKYGAHYVAHGCTGKGNDQVRFETGVQALNPDLENLAPVREWDLYTREHEIEWAKEHGVPVSASKESPYSIDDNLWGRAIECGILEDPWEEPPAGIYTITNDLTECPDKPEYVIISFNEGVPCALNGTKKTFREIIEEMNIIAGRNGYGRIDVIENRLVGLKSREVYEVPGALAIIKAHKALEDLCLEGDLLHYKLSVEHKWAELVYSGLWYSPLKEALDEFNKTTQSFLTGDVRLKFLRGNCSVVGRRSNYSLYDYNLATYNKGDSFNRDAAEGFIELWGLSTKIWARQRERLCKKEEV